MALLFAWPDQQDAAARLAKAAGLESGALAVHHFPDGETLVRLDADVAGQDVWLYASLNAPDSKAMGLMFFARTARDLGARSVKLVAPYLGYMRQDKRFHAGEAITSAHFARFLSDHFDALVTVDPHLHRYKALSEIYSIPALALHGADAIADWIKANVAQPLLIGPDEESDQWVAEVAARAGADYTVLEKQRHGDKQVEISVPDVARYSGHTPVLVDDIVSTARTMIGTIAHLQKAGMKPPVCIGVHAVFSGDGYEALQAAGAGQIVTCTTILHPTNAIDLTALLADGVQQLS